MTTHLRKATNTIIDKLTSIGVRLPFKLQRRDPKEPGREDKEALERKIYKLYCSKFLIEKTLVEENLLRLAPNRKSLFGFDEDYYMAQLGGVWDNEELEAQLGNLLVLATMNGVSLFEASATIGMDYTTVNMTAGDWARKYAGLLITGGKDPITGDVIRSIDTKTRDVIRTIIGDFIDTPGMTIGDAVKQISAAGFSDDRAMMIATTETTKAYAMADNIAGQQMKKEFHDVRVVKRWFTNNDDRVCPICGPNHLVTVELDEPFPSGDYQPPGHPRCRCWRSTTTAL